MIIIIWSIFILLIASVPISFYFSTIYEWKTNKKWRFYDSNYKSLGYDYLNKLVEKAIKEL